MNRSTFCSNLPALCLLASLGALTLAVPEADASVAYIRSTVGSPWGSTANEQAMDLVFGMGGWEDLRYETVVPADLFSDQYAFIYMEGSDSNASELTAFLSANQPALEAWVNAGGRLFLNAGPNEGGNIPFGFGGVTCNYPGLSTNPGTAFNAAHPIYNGPFLPVATSYTGGSYAHAYITGPGLTPLLRDANFQANLSEDPTIGAGQAVFGGLTTSNFWMPQPEALNFRANIIAYLVGPDTDGDGVYDIDDNCVAVMNPMQVDTDMDGLGDMCDDCPMDPLNDADMDLACDSIDNCPGLMNPLQTDADMDGAGDDCDMCPMDPDDDVDADTVCGDVDNCPDDSNVNQADDDMDGLGNVCDACPDSDINDADGDGVCGDVDNCPDDANPDQADADGDGIGDACDEPVGGDSSGGGGGDGSTGGGGDGNVDGGSTGGGGDGGSGSTGAAEEEYEYDPGCGCTSDPKPAPAGWWLGLFALFGLRRRRRAA